ncbi:MAG: ATP-binding cassette domain-containing protein [Desulfomicrobium escambiense]|nr:ATP-binding cassette domain-containing protein [Desulfomicrobium escambiense]
MSTCRFDEGEIVALIGPNGAGKTTFFNCITGIYKPTEGDMLFIRRRAARPAAQRLEDQTGSRSSGMARTFQNIRLFQSMTVLENVMIGRHCRTKVRHHRGDPARPQTHARGARDRGEKLRHPRDRSGLAAMVNELAKNLPYGAQRRLEIARALATEPVPASAGRTGRGHEPAGDR